MSTTPASTAVSSNLTFRVRPSNERGHANHGWLNSYHTFSFASYFAPEFDSFGSLRVINEDRVAGGEGFGRHSHRDFEIFSYVVRGTLKHDDSLGNSELLTRGDVQFTSAGRGISHSEFNGSGSEYVHFLQMWVRPASRGLPPVYATARFTDDDKHNQLRLLISPTGRNDSIVIQQECLVYATLLDSGKSVTMQLQAGRRAYVHVVMETTGLTTERHETSVTLSGGQAQGAQQPGEQATDGEQGSRDGKDESAVTLQSGDGCYVELTDAKQPAVLTLTGHSQSSKQVEVIVFDLA